MDCSAHPIASPQPQDPSQPANDNAPVHVRVDGSIALPLDTTPQGLLARLFQDITFRNPEFVKRERMKISTWGIPEFVSCANESGNELRIPRGAVAMLRSHAAQQGVLLKFEDHRSVGTALELGAGLQAQLRDYQRDALRDAVTGVQGSLILPCGAGKSLLGTAIIAHIGRSALVLVHTHDLLEQWRTVIRSRLGIEAGVIADGSVQLAPVTIATVQTLVRLSPKHLTAIGSAFGVVLVDECQHTPAATFQTVLHSLPARWRYGLTATPEREDGLTPLLDFSFGKRLFQTTYQELVSMGFLTTPTVVPLYSDLRMEDPTTVDFNACVNALVSSATRNELVLDRVTTDVRDDHTVLVLSGRVDHCQSLSEKLKERGIEAGVLVGSTSPARRKLLLDRFRSGDLRVVVACTIADEGLDVPRLDRIVLAFPSRTEARITQRLGRLMRLHPGKQQPILYDVVDAGVPLLYKQFLARRRLYKSLLGVHIDTQRIRAQHTAEVAQ